MRKKIWLWAREKTVKRLLRLGVNPDTVLYVSTLLLTDGKGGVESPDYYDAVRWVVREKFAGLTDFEVYRIANAVVDGKSEEGSLAKLEVIRRKENR